MPLETVIVTVEIGTHTDSLPLNGPRLAQAIAEAIERNYREGEHEGLEIIECESVSIEGENWLPHLPCRQGDHEYCRSQEPHGCRCECHTTIDARKARAGDREDG